MSQDASEAGEAGEADGNTDPRATVHAARCLESAHCLFDSACAALRRKEHWGCTVIQKLMSHDDAFTDGLPDHGYGYRTRTCSPSLLRGLCGRLCVE